jgi:hypothetical protein
MARSRWEAICSTTPLLAAYKRANDKRANARSQSQEARAVEVFPRFFPSAPDVLVSSFVSPAPLFGAHERAYRRYSLLTLLAFNSLAYACEGRSLAALVCSVCRAWSRDRVCRALFVPLVIPRLSSFANSASHGLRLEVSSWLMEL